MPNITGSEYTFTSSNGKTPIHVREWVPDCDINGVVQLLHGVAEHIDRYDGFARALAAKGFVVVGNDHLGHGKSLARPADLGFFAEKDGWRDVVDDVEWLRQLTVEKWPEAPYFLLGHSMGSFAARTYMIRYPDAPLRGVILSGTGEKPLPALLGGIALCSAEIARHGPRYRSKTVNAMAFSGYNRDFEPRRTEFDWLSRNEAVVDAYAADPLCGFLPTVSLYRDMMEGMLFNYRPANLEKMNKDLPVYFFSGDKDPVGACGTGVARVYAKFLSAGMKDVFYRFYPDGRHEMLNDTEKDRVYGDVLDWLFKKIG